MVPTKTVTEAEIVQARELLISLRDGALLAGKMDEAVLLSHTIALLADILEAWR